MNLQMEELFFVLTQECFFAADHFKKILGVQQEKEYDAVFKHMSSALQPIIMWDGLIPEHARQNVVRGVVERSDLNQDMHAQVNADFLNYVRHNASDNMAPFLNVLVAHYDEVNYSGKDFEYPSDRFPLSLFYGEWMEEYALKDDLQILRTVHNRIDDTKFDKKDLSRDERITLIISQLEQPEERKFFMDFVGRHSQHPKFSYILEKFCEHNDHHYDFMYSSFPTFEKVLSPDTRRKLSDLTGELHTHWNNFNSQRVNILISLLAAGIQQRCVDLLTHMENDVGASLSVTVAPLDKSNVEGFRSKHSGFAPSDSHKI